MLQACQCINLSTYKCVFLWHGWYDVVRSCTLHWLFYFYLDQISRKLHTPLKEQRQRAECFFYLGECFSQHWTLCMIPCTYNATFNLHTRLYCVFTYGLWHLRNCVFHRSLNRHIYPLVSLFSKKPQHFKSLFWRAFQFSAFCLYSWF